jgi:hypothetical protein
MRPFLGPSVPGLLRTAWSGSEMPGEECFIAARTWTLRCCEWSGAGARRLVEMKRRTTLLIACVPLLILAAGVSACGGSGGDGEEAGRPTATASPQAVATRPVGQLTPMPSPEGMAGEPTIPATPAGTPGNIMAVDVDPASAAIDSTTTQPLGTPFETTINVTAASDEYNTYQFLLQWDNSILSFVSAAHANPDDFTACFDFDSTVAGRVGTACGRSAGPSTFVAPTDRITLRCEAQGVSALHLVASAEDPLFGTLTIDAGREVATDTVDASVTCQ